MKAAEFYRLVGDTSAEEDEVIIHEDGRFWQVETIERDHENNTLVIEVRELL